MKIIAGFTALILVAVVSYAGWQIARKWNYFWSYESMVKQTVCEMVKPEHLIKPCN